MAPASLTARQPSANADWGPIGSQAPKVHRETLWAHEGIPNLNANASFYISPGPPL